MEKMYRDFTVCENCGETCYLGNKYCEDCANKLVAEKETRITELEDKDWYEGTIKQLEEQNERLINQLAEKDNLLKMYPRLEDMYPQLPTIVISNQDKISFAVEQLEKVKEELDKHDKIETFVDIYGDSAVNRSDLEFFIDDQIKQLKEIK